MALQRYYSFSLFFVLVLSYIEIKPNKTLAFKLAHLQEKSKPGLTINLRFTFNPFRTTRPRSVFSRNSHEFGLHDVYLNRDGTKTKSWNYWNPSAKLEGNLKPKWNCIRYVLGALKDFYHSNSLGFRWDLNISFPSCSLLRSATLFRESLYHYKENMRHKASAFISFNWPLKIYYFL